MKNLVSFLILFTLVTFEAQARKQCYYLDQLGDYNLTVEDNNRHITTYRGAYNGLSLNFLGSEEEVIKIGFMFAQGDNEAYIAQMSEVMSALFADDFTSSPSFSAKMSATLNKLKKAGDDKTMRADGIRFEMKLANGMIYVDAIPQNRYNLYGAIQQQKN